MQAERFLPVSPAQEATDVCDDALDVPILLSDMLLVETDMPPSEDDELLEPLSSAKTGTTMLTATTAEARLATMRRFIKEMGKGMRGIFLLHL